ncbi:MAG: YgaP family membrane protein [Aggregatilineales bacterium]
MSLIKFLASPAGRLVRIIAGIVLVAVGLFVMQNTAGIVLAVIGLVPLLAGLLDVCIFAPLFGASFSGKAIRATK